ncbi:hypothetical protein PHLH6_27570 [Pseudomonas sp. Seg1]|nr:hypothetical protein PHLH6_27570 [Pseudomonas sp. Seg1]
MNHRLQADPVFFLPELLTSWMMLTLAGSFGLVFFKPIAQVVQNLMGSLDSIDVQSFRQLINPGHLKLHRQIECFSSSFSQDNQLRPAVVWVRLKLQQSILHQIVDDPLNVLPIRPHVASNP